MARMERTFIADDGSKVELVKSIGTVEPDDPSYAALPLETDRDESRPTPAEDVGELIKQVGIPQDAYGCAILAIVREFQEAAAGRHAVLNGCIASFCMAMYVLNLVLQFAIVRFISIYVVGPRIEAVQVLYKAFHGNSHDTNGIFEEDQFSDTQAVKLCQIAMTNRTFYYTILFLWCISMLKEFRNTERLFRDISSLPTCQRVEQMLVGEGSEQRIIALTCSIRFALYTLVCIPKLCICIALLFLGCEWLSATDKFESLVMNTVAMEFVTGIDELLYAVMIPVAFRTELEMMTFTLSMRKPGQTPKSESEQRLDDLKKGFTRSSMYVMGAIGWLVVYSEYLQTVFPQNPSDVAQHCGFLWDTNNRPCNKFDGKFINFLMTGSYPSSEECFPYGVDYDPA